MNPSPFFPVVKVKAPAWRVALLVAGAWLVPLPALAAETSEPLRKVTCSFAGMVDDVREALKTGSPALKRYVRTRLKEAALAMPPEELRAAVAGERDPAVLEVLGAALATKSSYAEDSTLLQPLLSRAQRDATPEARAAAVRGLRGIGSVEALAKAGEGVSYEQLVRDPSPEVRAAVADNLVFESAEVYSGHSRTVSESALSTALASPDPEVAAKLLGEVSMEQVGAEAVGRLMEPLRSDSPKLRASAASALGGVPGVESSRAREALVELYRTEKDPAVRKAALEGIARLGQAGSRPVLESLRGVHPGMDPEVDAWLKALGTGLQEWHLLLREKQRLRK
jgi:HEAT repeat protein